MKDMFKIAGIFALMVILIPLVGIFAPISEKTASDDNTAEAAQPPEHYTADDNFLLLEASTGRLLEITTAEYVKGAVLAEMPASFHDEALKAQAVAAHTYALRRKQQQLASPDPALKGAYVSDDSSKYQAYFSPAQAEHFYGEAYAEYDSKITRLVDEVINDIVVYDGEPVVAAFHSSSSGMTESAEIIWGNHIDYLVPVESPEDENAPSVYGETVFTADELSARLTQSDYGIILPDNEEEWLEISAVSPSGTVTEIRVGDKVLSGMEMRTLLNLKSADFTLNYADGSFTFITKGNGHGVGLSQYGAETMAQNGSSYKEILLHYYKGAEIADCRNFPEQVTQR